MQLTKAWEACKAEKRIEGFSPHTLNAYRLQANLLVRHFQDIKPQSVTTQGIKDYLALSSEGLKPSSLAHRVRFIRSFFRWLYEEGHITTNPAAKITEPKVGKRIPKFLTEREVYLIADVIFG
ncbi:hypothetical protein AJ85_13175 [Alkalihalobacillus alcalophilus ATCC 27647 = CGMCC 1.3604]|uniref:Core-binding (CB) domain-containing protein n=1 Tax=Alkalihalobacillus alcalophilus ATCC 27647 = CGMCC 1.3604 TaxID=1218173 RepID=A0A4S4K3Y5_ALKAL|nr:site-specific integrase [Alkalihalobacillus alcalophilus]MED1562752.1 site-specific integrase [Alkalihalobacillus alcalophilus]THG92385.1 hypothetical protein AJ85_13175 [Alkalihalobacillus alcalophilus ATCC 27647 = CGMCC 1.3604]